MRAADLVLFGPAIAFAVAAAIGLAWAAADDHAWGPIARGREVVGSSACARCHPEAHASWHRTYHRTMTQSADGDAPLAPFAGERLDYLGFRATMDRAADGRPRIRIDREDDPAAILDATVVMTVGSHRYQQYLARIDRGGGDEEVWRLPVAWHIGEARWIHLNAAFLEPEGAAGDEGDYLRHLSRWNDNCIFCHNTEPRPGLGEDGRFRSSVGELGIACEACHGPGEAHLDRHGDPLRRLLAAVDLDDRDADGSITDPLRVDAARSSEICGRCHGNRIARDLAAVLRRGDGFLPGEALAEVSRPIFRDSTVGDADHPFVERFWPDGTPRLSAYEYQGLLLSPCVAGGLGCNDCHTMHGGDPSMQVRDDRQGSAACRGCHDEAAIPAAHGGHAPAIGCLECHMPRTTYGLVEGMISHRITSPDPGALVGRGDQPDACTQCHVDRSRTWAAASMAGLGLRGSPAGAPAEEEAWGSRVLLDLHGGDPIQRILAIHALGRPGASMTADERRRWIVDALEDEYPAVRFAALRTLRALTPDDPRLQADLRGHDFLGEADQRVADVDALRARLGPGPLDDRPAIREWLASHRDASLLWIGE
ncbi:MAG: cytochrome c3 family protein [Nannocystaceae bacterium]